MVREFAATGVMSAPLIAVVQQTVLPLAHSTHMSEKFVE